MSDQFAIDAVRDLDVAVSWSNVQGSHVQQLRFLSPSGDEYQKLESAFDAAKLTLDAGLPTVHNTFPIAGTWIQQRATVGVWTVNVYLDGKLITSSPLNLR